VGVPRTALLEVGNDPGRRSPKKLVKAVVARVLGRKGLGGTLWKPAAVGLQTVWHGITRREGRIPLRIRLTPRGVYESVKARDVFGPLECDRAETGPFAKLCIPDTHRFSD
jgi:hypothetical protein